ncbi:MAG: CobW family GTP-binding protein [Atopobiaceae bacterium]|jgi:G3E family GTPase
MEKAKVDIVIGFLGAGKTTLINQILKDGVSLEKPVVIENEFGDVGIDGDLIPKADAEVRMLASGCICCTLKGDFIQNLEHVVTTLQPKRILIEPTGLANLDDMVAVVEQAAQTLPIELDAVISVVDAETFLEMIDYCGEFYLSQIRDAALIVLTHTADLSAADRQTVDARLHELSACPIMEADLTQKNFGLELLAAAQAAWGRYGLKAVSALTEHTGDKNSALHASTDQVCAHDHDDGSDHDHAHDHALDHHGHLHAPDGLTSVVVLPSPLPEETSLEQVFSRLENAPQGVVFRAKGFFVTQSGQMLHAEYVLGKGSYEASDYAGGPKFVVIGQHIDEAWVHEVVEEVTCGEH